ncbi:MAG TPA: BMP family ABC transporter substrate-binding protein, partial [Candidatus Methylomirabilis sp.]
VPWFGTQSDQSALASQNVVASQVYHWEVVLRQVLDLIANGTLGGQAFAVNLANQGEVIQFNSGYALPADVRTAADNAIAGISDGSITITLP